MINPSRAMSWSTTRGSSLEGEAVPPFLVTKFNRQVISTGTLTAREVDHNMWSRPWSWGSSLLIEAQGSVV